MNVHAVFLADAVVEGASARLCATLLHSLWQTGLAAVAAGLVGRLLCRARVEWKYAVHVAALVVSVVALPVTFSLVLRDTSSRGMRARDAEVTVTRGEAVDARPVMRGTRGEVGDGSETAATRQSATGEVVGAHDIQQAAEETRRGGDGLWVAAAPWAAGVYLAGVVAMLLRLTRGVASAERMRRAARPLLAGAAAETLRRLVREWNLRAAPALAQAERVAIPTLVGLLKPTILLPGAALAGLSTGELEMILAHELAHVRRRDMWVNLLQRLAEVVLFFNPALWWLSRRISTLREYCCDEMACGVRAGTRSRADASGNGARVDYAAALLRVVELACAGSARASDLATLAASGRSPSELRRRVARMLGEPLREPLELSRGGLVFAAAIVLAITVAPAWLHSQDSQALVPWPVYPPPKTDADAAVAAARAKTFGVGGAAKISMRLSYWSGDVASMKGTQAQSLKALVGALGQPVDDASRSGSDLTATLAWDGPKLLFQTDTSERANAATAPSLSTYSHYWTGADGWIGETTSRGRSVFRYAALDKMMEGWGQVMHVYLPQWVAGGGLLTWPGGSMKVDQYTVDPELTRYKDLGPWTIAGVECQMYEGPARREVIWIEKATGLVKAVCHRNVHEDLPNYYTELVRAVAGRTFKDSQEYGAWVKEQPKEVKDRLSAFWSAAHFESAEPDLLLVFNDYREIAPGVQWPMRCETVTSLPNGNDPKKTGYRYLRGETIVADVKEEFSIESLGSALPREGDKVVDRRAEPEVEYFWRAGIGDGDIETLRKEKIEKKKEKDDATQRIIETPINSVGDAIVMLTDGPNVDPATAWARAIKYLVDHKAEGLPAAIKQLDAETRDHPIAKLAFALRAMKDPRAVPALIRALPKTLLPSRSDYGLDLYGADDELVRFMQENDQAAAIRSGPTFGYDRAFREVVTSLHRLTKKDFGDMELNWVSLGDSPDQRAHQQRQFNQLAWKWATWWESEGHAAVDDPVYAKVGLPPLVAEASPHAGREKPPAGAGVKLLDGQSGWVVEPVPESKKRCFVDLDTGRQGDWPAELGDAETVSVDSKEVLAWVAREGFDIVCVAYTPPGEKEPLFCLKPLGMRAWKISPLEHRRLGEAMAGREAYPLSQPVELMVPQGEVKPPFDSKYGGDAFLFITREGTAGLIRMTAQVTNPEGGGWGSYASGADDQFQPTGYHRGAKIGFWTMSEPDAAGR